MCVLLCIIVNDMELVLVSTGSALCACVVLWLAEAPVVFFRVFPARGREVCIERQGVRALGVSLSRGFTDGVAFYGAIQGYTQGAHL